MMGFTLPLFVLGGLQGAMSAFLLLPAPLNKPAIKLVQISNTEIGRTVVYTISAFLGFLLIAPLFDLMQLFQTHKATVAGMASPDTLTSPEHRAVEATSTLSAVMTGALLMNMFVLQKFGLVLGYNEQLAAGKFRAPEEAQAAGHKLGLKQPKGTHEQVAERLAQEGANFSSQGQTPPQPIPTPADPLVQAAGPAPVKKEL